MKRSPDESTHGNLIYFGNHRCLSWSEESKCMWTQGNDGAMWLAWCNLYLVFTYIYSLLIEKGISDPRNISVTMCLCVLSFGYLSIFWRVSPSFSYLLSYLFPRSVLPCSPKWQGFIGLKYLFLLYVGLFKVVCSFSTNFFTVCR